MEIFVTYKDNSDWVKYHKIGNYIPPDRSHFNFWTLYHEGEEICYFINADKVRTLEVHDPVADRKPEEVKEDEH